MPETKNIVMGVAAVLAAVAAAAGAVWAVKSGKIAAPTDSATTN